MKSFLLSGKSPICKWGSLKDETYFEGEVPKGYRLAICPHSPYIILDVDRHGELDGFTSIPINIDKELSKTFNYCTKNNGRHYWLKYTGNKELMNRASGLGVDLRTHKGYVRWYWKDDIRSYIHLVKNTSKELNKWLESLFYQKSGKY